MRLDELHYDLPPELIAQHPAARRDESRLLVLDRATGRIAHHVFRDLVDLLAPGDCLVLNDTRVIPARFHVRRASGRRIEGLFVCEEADNWHVLLRASRRLHPGERLTCEGANGVLVLIERLERGAWRARPDPPVAALDLLARIGEVPLPPYIHREVPDSTVAREDVERYQTVYARQPGAVAAPTAGLHFTPELLAELAHSGVRRADVTLHVGTGTFVPIEVADLAEHHMHAEWYELGAPAAAVLNDTRAAGGRIVAVGTTATRVLETAVRASVLSPAAKSGTPIQAGAVSPSAGWTDIFIYPPFKFRCVNRLITNFHLPGSTLLALVMAFATPELTRAAYAEAIARRYRFYSYGDAMLIV